MDFDIREFETDKVKELEGVWVYFDLEETQGLLIARAFNENFMKVFRKLPRGFQIRAKMQTLDKKSDLKVWHKLLSETILLDWKKISHEGKPLGKYTPEAGAEYMNKYKGFTNFAWEMANEEALYHEEQAEEDEKNLPASSATV